MTDTPTMKEEIDGKVPDLINDDPKPVIEDQAIDIQQVKSPIKQIETTQKSISDIHKLISSIIDSIAQNQSMLARAALQWGRLPLWQKIGLGTVLIVPTLILGIVFQMYVLLAISALTLITFTACNYILDNHYDHEERVTDQLKEAMIGMANSLEQVIESMKTAREELATEIDKFHQKNEQLTNKIIELKGQVDELTHQLEQLSITEKELRAIQVKLEQTHTSLKDNIEEQTELLAQNKAEIEQTQQAMEKNQLELSEKTKELDEVRIQLGEEIESAQKVSESLQVAIESLAKNLIKDDKERESFQSKLTTFLTDKERSFDAIAKRICDATRELSLVKDELSRANLRYKNLLERQEKQIHKLEQSSPTVKPALDKTDESPLRQVTNLMKHGIHAPHKHKHHHTHSKHETTRLEVVRTM